MTTPYTYLIKFKPTNQYYYGVKYAKDCHPEQLWNSYFTSSKVVKQLILNYGKEAFDVEVRQTFKSSKKAIQWEHRILKKLNVAKRKDFLNRTDNSLYTFHNCIWINNGITAKFIDIILAQDFLEQGWQKGRIFTADTRKKFSSLLKGKPAWNTGKVHSSSTRKRIKEGLARKGTTVMGKNNNAKPITVDNVSYSCMKEAQQVLGITRTQLLKRLGIRFQP